MSPSKRAGDTAEESASTSTDAAANGSNSNGSNGNGAHDGGSAGPARIARRPGSGRAKRRSTTAAVAATAPPERGSDSQRGASSSSITRRSATGSAPAPAGSFVAPPVGPAPEAERPVADTAPRTLTEADVPANMPAEIPTFEEDDEPATTSPRPLPTGRVEPSTRRPGDGGLTGPPLPVIVPVPQGPPVPGRPVELPAGTSEAPYRTATMSSHQIAPVPRVMGRRPRVRKVTRVVRHVDPWSIFKVALVFNLVLYAVLLTAGVLLWNVAYATGTIDNLERFFESFGWSDFEFNGGAIYHAGWIAGLFGVVGLTGAAVLAGTLFNLITDLVGGVRMTVLEEEVVERTAAPMRRFVVRRPSGPDPGGDMRMEGSTLPVRPDPEEGPPT